MLQAVTEFHVLLLYPTRLLALNAVSQAPVQDIALAGRGAPGYAGQPLALATDPATAGIYLYTSATADPTCGIKHLRREARSGRGLHLRDLMQPEQHTQTDHVVLA